MSPLKVSVPIPVLVVVSLPVALITVAVSVRVPVAVPLLVAVLVGGLATDALRPHPQPITTGARRTNQRSRPCGAGLSIMLQDDLP